ncbi:hypothetical protein [Pilibacter termitis]|uniref:hypothetical protein n=1 Tax=Pilibacter termitis TaxID=263852 RepID=UPI0011864666|nr:hypothetical protein [Pilibacter termitis]
MVKIVTYHLETVGEQREKNRSLIQLELPEEEVKVLTYCRKGYRYIEASKVVPRGLFNKRQKQRGIPFALDYYLKVHTAI